MSANPFSSPIQPPFCRRHPSPASSVSNSSFLKEYSFSFGVSMAWVQTCRSTPMSRRYFWQIAETRWRFGHAARGRAGGRERRNLMHADNRFFARPPFDSAGKDQRTGGGAIAAGFDLGAKILFADQPAHFHRVGDRTAGRMQHDRFDIDAALFDFLGEDFRRAGLNGAGGAQAAVGDEARRSSSPPAGRPAAAADRHGPVVSPATRRGTASVGKSGRYSRRPARANRKARDSRAPAP